MKRMDRLMQISSLAKSVRVSMSPWERENESPAHYNSCSNNSSSSLSHNEYLYALLLSTFRVSMATRHETDYARSLFYTVSVQLNPFLSLC